MNERSKKDEPRLPNRPVRCVAGKSRALTCRRLTLTLTPELSSTSAGGCGLFGVSSRLFSSPLPPPPPPPPSPFPEAPCSNAEGACSLRHRRKDTRELSCEPRNQHRASASIYTGRRSCTRQWHRRAASQVHVISSSSVT
jgi:hypothetical protein